MVEGGGGVCIFAYVSADAHVCVYACESQKLVSSVFLTSLCMFS